jgi:hypothetical protein
MKKVVSATAERVSVAAHVSEGPRIFPNRIEQAPLPVRYPAGATHTEGRLL